MRGHRSPRALFFSNVVALYYKWICIIIIIIVRTNITQIWFGIGSIVITRSECTNSFVTMFRMHQNILISGYVNVYKLIVNLVIYAHLSDGILDLWPPSPFMIPDCMMPTVFRIWSSGIILYRSMTWHHRVIVSTSNKSHPLQPAPLLLVLPVLPGLRPRWCHHRPSDPTPWPPPVPVQLLLPLCLSPNPKRLPAHNKWVIDSEFAFIVNLDTGSPFTECGNIWQRSSYA